MAEKCEEKEKIDLPPTPTDFKRLWIGNLDPRVNEYNLLKLLQQYGTIEKFDLLFHRSGPLAGQPRGYAFATFVQQKDALKAKETLHNKQVGTKNIVVTWAHSVNGEEVEKPKPEVKIPALAMTKCEKKVDRLTQIQAIEEKLKLMEKRNSDELEINKTVAAEPCVVSKYQFNKQSTSGTSVRPRTYHSRRNDKYNKPYARHKR